MQRGAVRQPTCGWMTECSWPFIQTLFPRILSQLEEASSRPLWCGGGGGLQITRSSFNKWISTFCLQVVNLLFRFEWDCYCLATFKSQLPNNTHTQTQESLQPPGCSWEFNSDCSQVCPLPRSCGFLTVRNSASCVVCLHTDTVCVWRCVCFSSKHTAWHVWWLTSKPSND